MKILVLSKEVWSTEKPWGNTLSNWFGGEEWKDVRFQCICTRNGIPNNQVCDRYYKINIIDIIKHLLSPSKIGECIESSSKTQIDENRVKDITIKERNAIEKFKKIKMNWIREIGYAVVEKLYYSKIWLNKKFKSFIDEFSPDIVFSYFGDDGFVKPIIEYVKNNTKAKVVLMACDNVYGFATKASFIRRQTLLNNLTWLANHADCLFGATEEICTYYHNIFDKSFAPLYKGCELNFKLKEKHNYPKLIVYAGNLLYGRDKVLCELTRALKKINSEGIKAILEIYTGTPVPEDDAILNDSNCSKIVGVKPYSEIVKIMQDADIVLHVESFEQEQINTVRYSFSTKIIDCLQSGSVCMAIGPSDVASIKYFKRIAGATVVNNIDDIEKTIRSLIKEENLNERALMIRQFANEFHNLHTLRQNLRNNFEALIK